MTNVKTSEHSWQYCKLCGHDVVICWKCGNNSCNGGSGKINDVDCDECDSAYELYVNNFKEK